MADLITHPEPFDDTDGLLAEHHRAFSGLVRTSTLSTMHMRAAQAAARMSKRMHGVRVHLWVGEPRINPWCSIHGVFGYCEASPYVACRYVDQWATPITVTATGLPIYGGEWRVAGVLQTDTEGVTTAHSVGESADGFALGYVHRAGECVHCNTDRNRRVTVLLVDAAGTVRPIGRSCLAEYTGAAIRAEVVVGMFRALRELDEDMADASRSALADSAPVEDIVAVARILVSRHGFVPSYQGTPRNPSTAERVRDCVVPIGKRQGEICPAELTEEHRAAARADLDVIRAMVDDTSEYITNMRAVIANDWCQATGKGQKVGLLASLPAAADRARAKAVARETAAQRAAEADWIGTVGEKATVSGKVTLMRAIEGDYGTRWLIKVETPAGPAKMFTTARALVALDEGAEVTIAATVKSHDEWRGGRETTLVRPKLVAA